MVQGRGSYRCWRESTTVPGVFSRLDEGIKETRAILRAPYGGRARCTPPIRPATIAVALSEWKMEIGKANSPKFLTNRPWRSRLGMGTWIYSCLQSRGREGLDRAAGQAAEWPGCQNARGDLPHFPNPKAPWQGLSRSHRRTPSGDVFETASLCARALLRWSLTEVTAPERQKPWLRSSKIPLVNCRRENLGPKPRGQNLVCEFDSAIMSASGK